MKSKLPHYLTAGLCALAFAFASATALAQDAGDKKPKGPSKADLKKYDTNKDGHLDDAETAAMKADKAAKRQADLDKYDENKDGKLSKEEREKKKADEAAARAAKKAERESKAKSKGN